MIKNSDPLHSLPTTVLKGVGPRVAERLKNLAITTVQDLLFHLPQRYEDRTHVLPMGSLRGGEQTVVEGVVELTEVKLGRRRSLLCRLSDGTGFITLRFFHFNRQQQQGLARGARLRCFGEVRRGPTTLEMIHPEYQRISADAPPPDAEGLTPVYPATEGLHQLSLRNLTTQALASLADMPLPDYVPAEVSAAEGYPPLVEALRLVHRPPANSDINGLQERQHPAQRRLAFEELLAHQLSMRLLRERVRHDLAPAISRKDPYSQPLREAIPFQLTAAQDRVLAEIYADLTQPHPMLRLVQGDVGSGKTIVAALAALRVVAAGFQVAVMAPTELLAEQHMFNFTHWLEPLGIEVAWLSGRLKGKARQAELERIGGGEARLVVGTHALFQEEVVFDRLGLVIIDEQHRFGVHQRLALREKGKQGAVHPHQLIMTATPIPRTLTMTAYADLDCSVIDELPPGRTPVKTVVLPEARREEVVARVRRACDEGAQAYWVCTLVEESEALQCQAAEDTRELLGEVLPELRIALVHGRMKADEKAAVMQAFKASEIDLLVATTVIEVGVDVPNASLMIIENAERLGLAQLHQLRGRVGRGGAESHCVLMYKGPLGERAHERLAVMRETNDGFEVARKDLELRGPGEVLGTRQSGVMNLRIADLLRDQALIPQVQRVAGELIAHYPDRVVPLVRRWLGEASDYGQV